MRLVAVTTALREMMHHWPHLCCSAIGRCITSNPTCKYFIADNGCAWIEVVPAGNSERQALEQAMQGSTGMQSLSGTKL